AFVALAGYVMGAPGLLTLGLADLAGQLLLGLLGLVGLLAGGLLGLAGLLVREVAGRLGLLADETANGLGLPADDAGQHARRLRPLDGELTVDVDHPCCRPRCLHMVRQQSLLMNWQR